MMTVGNFLADSVQQLQGVGIETARLDTLVLLEDVLEIDRALLLAHPERALSTAALDKLNTFIAQRKRHVPLAYVRGKASFYGREFLVTPDVLVPRPESESMVEVLLGIAPSLPTNPCIVDVGTGSGCIGITAKLALLPDAKVTLLDIDTAALDIARRNAKALRADVQVLQSDLLTGYNGHIDVILANLPYVPQDYQINRAAMYEPSIALFSGSDGLDAYRLLWKQLGSRTQKPAHVITEALPKQHPALQALAAAEKYKATHVSDFIQHFALTA